MHVRSTCCTVTVASICQLRFWNMNLVKYKGEYMQQIVSDKPSLQAVGGTCRKATCNIGAVCSE